MGGGITWGIVSFSGPPPPFPRIWIGAASVPTRPGSHGEAEVVAGSQVAPERVEVEGAGDSWRVSGFLPPPLEDPNPRSESRRVCTGPGPHCSMTPLSKVEPAPLRPEGLEAARSREKGVQGTSGKEFSSNGLRGPTASLPQSALFFLGPGTRSPASALRGLKKKCTSGTPPLSLFLLYTPFVSLSRPFPLTNGHSSTVLPSPAQPTTVTQVFSHTPPHTSSPASAYSTPFPTSLPLSLAYPSLLTLPLPLRAPLTLLAPSLCLHERPRDFFLAPPHVAGCLHRLHPSPTRSPSPTHDITLSGSAFLAPGSRADSGSKTASPQGR